MQGISQAMSLMLKTNTPNLSEEDIYLVNNLPYCKKCRTPRFFDFNGTYVRCLCECQTEERDEHERKKEAKRKYNAFLSLKRASRLPSKFENVSFEDTNTARDMSFIEALARANKYCSVAKEVLKNGYGMYLYGKPGVGKSHIMGCMVNELSKQFYSSLLLTESDISKSIRATFSGKNTEMDVINNIAYTDFLFLDDIGTEPYVKNGDNAYIQGKLYDILDKRCSEKKPTVFSSNYSVPQLLNRGLMEKTVDRITAMSNAIIEIKGDSYRVTERNEKAKELPY